MNSVLRGLIGSGFSGNQAAIAAVLKKKGFPVTQSTVSRALKKLGVIKVSQRDGARYALTLNEPKLATHQSIGDLVISVIENESTIVLKTNPGAAMFVAGFLDHYCSDFILGTIAGDDTIFVAPRSTARIRNAARRINEYLREN